MKIKITLFILCSAMFFGFTLGITETVTLNAQSTEGERNSADRLIGILVTKESLGQIDYDEYFEKNIDSIVKNNRKGTQFYLPNGKTYAKAISSFFSDEADYIFEGIEGFRLLAPQRFEDGCNYTMFICDDVFTDNYVNLAKNDTGDSVELRTTIYYLDNEHCNRLYLNPIYQTPAGEVYAVNGNGHVLSAPSTKQTLYEHLKSTANGTKATYEATFSVTFVPVKKPLLTRILQFASNNNLLRSEEFTPDSFPKSLKPLSETAYIVVESVKEDGIDRELVQKGDKDEAAYAFLFNDDGIGIKQQCKIEWE
ncbi:MAG: hypothetical protein K6G60_06635 [Lachnospiraceae bacterium]|nr:hypothetical protein [Lachnospiraceae bacterium]